MEWHIKKIKSYTAFDKEPEEGQKVWIETKNGIFPGTYGLWDWTVPTSLCFQFEGRDIDIIAWMPYSDIQPERSKREDSSLTTVFRTFDNCGCFDTDRFNWHPLCCNTQHKKADQTWRDAVL